MRNWLDRLLFLACAASTLGVCGILLGLIGIIAHHGLPAIGWRFVTQPMTSVGEGGGILYNLIGTGILIGVALGLSAPPAVGIALLERVYVTSPLGRKVLTTSLYIL